MRIRIPPVRRCSLAESNMANIVQELSRWRWLYTAVVTQGDSGLLCERRQSSVSDTCVCVCVSMGV